MFFFTSSDHLIRNDLDSFFEGKQKKGTYLMSLNDFMTKSEEKMLKAYVTKR